MKHYLMMIILAFGAAFAAPAAVCAADGINGEVIVSDPVIRATAGGVEISVSDGVVRHFAIYSITGQMVKQIDVADTAFVDLPGGCYIVKCSSWSKKIVVR